MVYSIKHTEYYFLMAFTKTYDAIPCQLTLEFLTMFNRAFVQRSSLSPFSFLYKFPISSSVGVSAPTRLRRSVHFPVRRL